MTVPVSYTHLLKLAIGGVVRLFQLVILFGQLFHIHLAIRELSGQLASGGVELFQFCFMLCLVLGSEMCIRDRSYL